MGCFGGCGDNNCWWIIILLLLVCGCGCGNGYGSASNYSNCCNQGPRDNCCCD